MQFNLGVMLALLFVSSVALADVPLTQADMLGGWQIDKESTHADGSNARGLETQWIFRADGTMEGITADSDAHARVSELRAILNYSVENGKLNKQAAPGRSKMETCVAVEKDGAKMVLKCQSIYFFMTKK